jgi:two-component system, OmpR family, sensor histidine kinase VicK
MMELFFPFGIYC